MPVTCRQFRAYCRGWLLGCKQSGLAILRTFCTRAPDRSAGTGDGARRIVRHADSSGELHAGANHGDGVEYGNPRSSSEAPSLAGEPGRHRRCHTGGGGPAACLSGQPPSEQAERRRRRVDEHGKAAEFVVEQSRTLSPDRSVERRWAAGSDSGADQARGRSSAGCRVFGFRRGLVHGGGFADRMRQVRAHLEQLEKMQSSQQQQGWFLDAAAIYCDAVRSLAAELAAGPVAARGLQAFMAREKPPLLR